MDEIIPKCVVYVPNSIIYYCVFCNANLELCLVNQKQTFDTINMVIYTIVLFLMELNYGYSLPKSIPYHRIFHIKIPKRGIYDEAIHSCTPLFVHI